ncbi:hypothetical protein ACHQM5_025207 [Ranunculus cassubicifolius]
MRNFQVIFALNMTTIFLFLLILSHSMVVDASRPLVALSDTRITPSWRESFMFIAQAYSGPSKRGKGH